MIKKSLLLSALLAVIFAAAGAEFRVRGKVSAPEVKNVAVCDGEKFYPVNPDGSFDFTFNYDGTGFIYLDYPSDLKPQGKWSAALTPGDNRVDFTLVKAGSVPETFTFVHGSDVQYNFLIKRAELTNDMAEIAAIIKDTGAEFITFPGDLTEYGEPEQLNILRGEIEKNKMNYFAFYGGHDRIRSKPSFKNFTASFGAPYFGWHFGGIYFFSPVSEYRSLPESYARTRQINWINNALSRLAPGTPVLVITHQPWYVFDQIEKFAAEGKIKLLGFLGAHTHYHNLYEYKGYPVLNVSVLRSHDTGSFTKRLRLVTINKNGIVATETRLLNQSQRVEPTLHNGDQLLLRVADHAGKIQAVSAVVNGRNVELIQRNQLVWSAVLPEKVSGNTPAQVTVKTSAGTWQKKIMLKNIDKLAWCAVLPAFQRQYPEAVIRGDKVIAGFETSELPVGKGGVIAYDRATGKKLWQYTGADIISGVAADDKTVRAIDINCNLLTLDINTGKLLRSTAIKRSSMYTRTHAGVKLADGKVLVAITKDGRCNLYCFDAATDAPAWAAPLKMGAAWNSVNYTVKDGVIYFAGDGCNGAARLADGKDIWRRHDASKSSAGTPLVIGEHVYFYLRATLVKLNAKTGELVWKDGKVPGSSSTIGGVCVKDGRVLAVSTNALVVDNDADGKRIYRRNLQPLHRNRGIKFQFLANTASPVLWQNKVLVLGDDGAVYDLAGHMAKCHSKLDADRNKPDMIFETGFAFKGDPVIDGDLACFIGFDGVLYALKY